MLSFKDYLKEAKYTKTADIEKVEHEDYGQELIIDIHDVPYDFFTVKNVRSYAEQLCDEIDMKRGPIHTWGENSQEHKAKHGEGAIKADGISCIQFLYSSSILVHALDEIEKVFVNVFSCNKFDAKKAIQFTEKHIGGKIVDTKNIIRE